MIRECKAFLLERAGQWNLPAGEPWTFLLHNNYHPHSVNINLLWFHNGSGFPRLVTKLFRQPEIPKREFDNLVQVHRAVPQCVPKPLYFGLLCEFWALWMEGVPGLRLEARRVSAAVVRSLAEMVAAIHRGLRRGGARADLDRYRRTVSQPLQTVADFGAAAAVRAGCARVAAQTSAQWIDSLPVIPQHGDLFLSNVLSHREEWHVVDWETFGTIDLPFYDLVTLLFSLLRAGGETPDQWDASLAVQVPAAIESYAEALGLSAADVPRLFPLILANWFHLQWCDGRGEFTRLMYRTIHHYFEHTEIWEKIFCPRRDS